MHKLEQYFDDSGSRAWHDLVNWSMENYWTNSESQQFLEQTLNNQTDVAKVTYARFGEASLETPELIKRLKEALSRMDL